jgi:hypothetical protein
MCAKLLHTGASLLLTGDFSFCMGATFFGAANGISSREELQDLASIMHYIYFLSPKKDVPNLPKYR